MTKDERRMMKARRWYDKGNIKTECGNFVEKHLVKDTICEFESEV